MPPFVQFYPIRFGIVFGWAIAAAFGQAPGAAAGDDPRWSELAQRASASATSASGREAQWRETAALAWAVYEAHPLDPRRWPAWEALLRSVPRFADDAAAKKLWDERTAALETAVAQAQDAPESLRELFAARKVSALVLPFTNGTLPPDWAERLVPPIEELAARFPGSVERENGAWGGHGCFRVLLSARLGARGATARRPSGPRHPVGGQPQPAGPRIRGATPARAARVLATARF